MYGGGTPWAYIHQKKATDQANSEKDEIEHKYEKLKKLTKKLINNLDLSNEDYNFLKEIGLK